MLMIVCGMVKCVISNCYLYMPQFVLLIYYSQIVLILFFFLIHSRVYINYILSFLLLVSSIDIINYSGLCSIMSLFKSSRYLVVWSSNVGNVLFYPLVLDKLV